jgi:hypothetical protein
VSKKKFKKGKKTSQPCLSLRESPSHPTAVFGRAVAVVATSVSAVSSTQVVNVSARLVFIPARLSGHQPGISRLQTLLASFCVRLSLSSFTCVWFLKRFDAARSSSLY